MKITIYELLGLMKDGKAPKKIKYDGDIYILKSNAIFELFAYETIDYNKFNTDGERLGKTLFLDNHYMHLYDEVEIIDEPKKIKKIKQLNNVGGCKELIELEDKQQLNNHILKDKINEIIDEINNLKEKKDEKNKC